MVGLIGVDAPESTHGAQLPFSIGWRGGFAAHVRASCGSVQTSYLRLDVFRYSPDDRTEVGEPGMCESGSIAWFAVDARKMLSVPLYEAFSLLRRFFVVWLHGVDLSASCRRKFVSGKNTFSYRVRMGCCSCESVIAQFIEELIHSGFQVRYKQVTML